MESKYLEEDFFEVRNFDFYDILRDAGLTQFVCLRRPFYPKLVRVFYSNLEISGTGVIRSKVRGVKIKVSPNLFYQLTFLPSTGVRYERGVVDYWKEHYNSITARQLVCKEDADLIAEYLLGD